jgi:hypothetical protein
MPRMLSSTLYYWLYYWLFTALQSWLFTTLLYLFFTSFSFFFCNYRIGELLHGADALFYYGFIVRLLFELSGSLYPTRKPLVPPLSHS